MEVSTILLKMNPLVIVEHNFNRIIQQERETAAEDVAELWKLTERYEFKDYLEKPCGWDWFVD